MLILSIKKDKIYRIFMINRIRHIGNWGSIEDLSILGNPVKPVSKREKIHRLAYHCAVSVTARRAFRTYKNPVNPENHVNPV
jgi:hypothetical protein